MKKEKEIEQQKEQIRLTDSPLANIIIMAPYLSEKQQYITFGMIMGLATENETVKIETR